MQKITPNMWFDGNAVEAVEFYTSIFPGGQLIDTQYYPDSVDKGLENFQLELAGQVLSIYFQLGDMRFAAINAGPEFRPNPAISMMLNFGPSKDSQARQNLDRLWEQLTDGGHVLMPLQKYDFSQHYGWVQDRYGVSWQLILSNPEGEPRPFIVPALLFGGVAQNRAEEAIEYYTSIFPDSGRGASFRYGEPTGPAGADNLAFADFRLAGQWFMANDSGAEQEFTFCEGLSLEVACQDQEEIDYYWSKLSANPDAEQCGWCKDKFGVSWQIVPANMTELMERPGAFKTLMNQHKIVIDEY